MSKFYLVNESNPAALSMAKKLIAHKGDTNIIQCSLKEIKAYYGDDIQEVQEVQEVQEPSIANPNVQLVEVEKYKNYLALCKLGFVSPHEIRRLASVPNIRVILTH